MEPRTLDLALACTRILSYSLIAFSIFFLAMCLGVWYEANILSSCQKRIGFELRRDFPVRDLDSQVVAFVSMPVVLAAALGGLYEALWKLRETQSKASVRSSKCRGISLLNQFRTVLRFRFRPVIGSTVWMSVGEFSVILLWFVAMIAQMWQAIERNGLHYNEQIHRCRDDPRRWCSNEDGHPMATPTQWRLRMLAVFFGFMASSHFAVILIPVARDSTLWAAVGIPFERAVLYHKVAGHLAFLSVFLHALFFVIVWAWQEGWDHIFHRSMGYGEREHGGMSLPSGWMAFLCGIPMWITSIGYVRRRWYSLFKLAHWMFIGVLLFSAMHWSPNVAFFMGGLSLYSLHVYSRLTSWKSWRFWHRWSLPGASVKGPVTSVVSVHTTEMYTRLVLRNPTYETPRGGAFVYISAPAALGTGEAHAFTVAYGGPPPGTTLGENVSLDNVHTLYVKSCGAWTRALGLVARAAESSNLPETLLVDVDGFYHHVNSFKSMMLQGNSRIVIFAGGSGLTCFTCYIQDWAAAASSGHPVPDVRVLWSCRDLQEMKLVGEAIPSLVSSVGSAERSRLSLELFCSGTEAKDRDDPSLTLPLYPVVHGKKCEKSAWASLHDSFRILLVGAAGYGGWLVGQYESYRRQVRSSFHEGATTLTIMVLSISIVLIGYRAACGLLGACPLLGVSLKRLRSPAAKVGSPPVDARVGDEIKDETGQDAPRTVTYPVTSGRIPTRGVLEHEAKAAEAIGLARVKVLVGGPSFLVDSVLLEARKINWRLFDTEAFSFEF